MNIIQGIIVALSVVLLTACDSGPSGSLGFTLPDGDVNKGKADYIAFKCNACHVNKSVPQADESGVASISVILGGETSHIKTYGELVTSIINPSHRVARRNSPDMADEQGNSLMVNFNDVMTVTQLIDLVAFVQSNYKLSPYSSSKYPAYWIPEPSSAKGQE